MKLYSPIFFYCSNLKEHCVGINTCNDNPGRDPTKMKGLSCRLGQLLVLAELPTPDCMTPMCIADVCSAKSGYMNMHAVAGNVRDENNSRI